MKRALRLLPLLLGLVAACSSKDGTLTQMVVTVDSDLSVPHQVDEIEIAVSGPSGDVQKAIGPVTGARAIALPLTLSISPAGDSPELVVRVTARFQGEDVVAREVSTRFVSGESRLLSVTLSRACLPITCAAKQTCSEGKCVSSDVAVEALAPWTGALPDRAPSTLGGAGVERLGPGEAHSCVVTTSRNVLCWGNNDEAELGTDVRAQRLAPRLVRNLEDVVEVASSVDFACARNGAGAVLCWGSNDSGQIGTGATSEPVAKPSLVIELPPATQVATGEGHACALDAAGGVFCWGHNHHGQLGDGTLVDAPKPVKVKLSGPAKQVAVGEDHTCALLATGGVQCWGANEFGALGNGVGDGADSPLPQTVKGLVDATAVRCGAYHVCAERAQRVVSCWGRNNRGQLGDNHASGDVSTIPVVVTGISDSKNVVAGEFHTCAQSESGIVACWGGNEFGQVGDGTTADRATPVPVQFDGSASIDELASGMFHTCARKALGVVRCWGSNEKGQLGDGTTENRTKPVNVIGLP